MKYENGRFSVYGNPIKKSDSKKTIKYQNWFIKKFNYDPDEEYTLSAVDNEYLGPIFGMKEIIRGGEGQEIDRENGVICSTVRMGYGHYRIAMAGVSCARAMGFKPYWLDLLAIPGITRYVINVWNSNYSKFSRISQRSA